MENFKSIFAAYGGDYETTMNRFMGNEELYLKILNMLSQDENLHKLETALRKEDFTGAFDAAHTLKGMAGNLGLTPLFDAVCRIVEPLRAAEQREDYPALCKAVELEFNKAERLRTALLHNREARIAR